MPEATVPADPHLWLEDVHGERALAWVREHNAAAERTLAGDPRFQSIYQRILAVLDSEAKIPYVASHGPHLYNFWQDGAHPRGLWRRTSFAEYQKDQPAWETVLDLDALGRAEGENWVWHGAQVLRPGHDRALVSLSRGGADAAVVREFDLVQKQFVADGFVLPEAKSQVAWRNRDELLVGTDFGPGTLTSSGYPRLAKLWRRGTPLASATEWMAARPDDVFLVASHDPTQGFERDLVQRAITFYTNEVFVVRSGTPVKIDKPDSATAHLHREWLLLELRDDWQVGATTYPAGALLAAELEPFLAGARRFEVLFTPTERTSLAGITPTRNHLLLTVLDQVASRVLVLTRRAGAWQSEPLPGLPEFGTVSVAAVDEEAGDDYWLTRTDYLQPTSLWHGTVGQGPPRRLKSLPACFDSTGLTVVQHTARSADGTEVPYFLVAKADLPHNGAQPTLLYGYGGFEVSLTPTYSAGAGIAWLEAGGVYAVANIRGGGEFGPKWHQAALGPHRHRAYEDFAAVAADLVRRGITSPRHLGCQGGSNGGLLMGNMLTSYPNQFGAIVCQVPLLDMLRYHRLLAGASWIGEYGDPEQPEAAVWLRRYSPYHNLQRAAQYPPVLFTTSTRDDRVHPGHARKTMAQLEALGHRALYYENLEGGHGGAADHKQAAYLAALAYTFLWQQLR
ncbi:MAG: S9 family peptidase [Planctomycetes bacterium]|nr:S9 family peptidase [Planctomycetota bacterium]